MAARKSSTMTQISFFDLGIEEQKRDRGIERVLSRAGAWSDRALAAVEVTCRCKRFFTMDDVWRYLDQGDPANVPPHPNAAGAILRVAAKKGWCRPTDRSQKTAKKGGHARKVTIWESYLREM